MSNLESDEGSGEAFERKMSPVFLGKGGDELLQPAIKRLTAFATAMKEGNEIPKGLREDVDDILEREGLDIISSLKDSHIYAPSKTPGGPEYSFLKLADNLYMQVVAKRGGSRYIFEGICDEQEKERKVAEFEAQL